MERLAQVPGSADGRLLWALDPNPDALVLVIDSAADLAALCQAFPYGAGELDYPAILAAGYAGVQVTQRAAEAMAFAPPYRFLAWDTEATCWLRWVFGAPSPLPPSTMRATISLAVSCTRHAITFSPAWPMASPSAATAIAHALYADRKAGTGGARLSGSTSRLDLQRALLSWMLLQWEIGDHAGRRIQSCALADLRAVDAALVEAVFVAVMDDIHQRHPYRGGRAMVDWFCQHGWSVPEHPTVATGLSIGHNEPQCRVSYACSVCRHTWTSVRNLAHESPVSAVMPDCPACAGS